VEAFVTLATFKTYLENQRTGASNDARLQAALDSGHRAIRDYLGRGVSTADASATVRSYAADGDEVLFIHDCAEITAVTENGVTLVAGTDYQAEPLNGIGADGETWPYYQLRRLNGIGWYTNPASYGAVTVTVNAKWGWPDVPTPIVEACKMLSKDIAAARELRGDVGGFGEFGVVRIRQNSLIASMLAPYKNQSAPMFAVI
jgi:hypothetical protein